MQNRVSAITRKIEQLPPDLQHEVEDFVEFVQSKYRPSRKEHLKMDWAGALSEYKDKYTALELEQKALEWRGD
jgi:hypothetical protein